MATLDWTVRKHLHRFRAKGIGKEARWDVLSHLIMSANIRNRAWPSCVTLQEDTGFGLDQIKAALKWLQERGAIENVPTDKRVDEERRKRASGYVWQLTGKIQFDNETINYLYIHDEQSSEIQAAKGGKVPSTEGGNKGGGKGGKVPPVQGGKIPPLSIPEKKKEGNRSIEIEKAPVATESASTKDATQTKPGTLSLSSEEYQILKAICELTSKDAELERKNPNSKAAALAKELAAADYIAAHVRLAADYKPKWMKSPYHVSQLREAIDTACAKHSKQAPKSDAVRKDRWEPHWRGEETERPAPAVTATEDTDDDDEDYALPPRQTEWWTVIDRTAPGTTISDLDAWFAAQGQWSLQLNTATYDTWLRDTFFVECEPVEGAPAGTGILKIIVRNEYIKDWLGHRFYRSMLHTYQGIRRNPVSEIVIATVYDTEWPKTEKPADKPVLTPPPLVDQPQPVVG